MASTFDHADQARAALAAIVADPEFGPAGTERPDWSLGVVAAAESRGSPSWPLIFDMTLASDR